MQRNSRLLSSCLLALSVALLAACGGVSTEPGPGAVRVSLTGGSGGGSGIDNAWITVRGILFHPADSAEPEDAGWVGQRFGDNETVTLDLARISNGALREVFDNVPLPAGRYRQILLFIEPTRSVDTVAASAAALGLRYNNQVDRTSGIAPLRIPDALRGIRLAGTFDVPEGAALRLAIDLDIARDAVRVDRAGAGEYLLKPLLRAFDLDRAGAVTGRIDAAAAADNAAFPVVMAEQPDADNTFRIVRRAASVAGATGRFVLYPLAPGRYDVVLRAFGRRSVIVRNVNVLPGGTPSAGAADLGTIAMPAGADFEVDARVSPAGSWVRFHQSLPADVDPVAYEIRFGHLNPLSGRFPDPLRLSAEPLRVGSYSTSGATIAFTDIAPVDNTGGQLPGAFAAAAEAALFGRGAPLQVVPADNGILLALDPLSPVSPAVARTAQGNFSMAAPGMGLTGGHMLAVRGGIVVDRLDVSAMMGDNGGHYAFGNLPGGSVATPFSRAVYGLDTLGWSATALAHGFRAGTPFSPPVADLRYGDRSGIDIRMTPMP